MQLGLLSELASMQSESKERSLLFDLWRSMQGDANEYVEIDSLKVIIQVILRLIDAKRVLNVQISNE